MQRRILSFIFCVVSCTLFLSSQLGHAQYYTPVPAQTPVNDPVCSSKATAHESEIRSPSGDKPPLTATLVRFCDENGCIIGELSVGNFRCYTLERPNWFNLPNVSCIPAETYVCESYSSEKFPKTYTVTQVKDRTHILFHGGKDGKVTKYNTRGCIALGLEVNPERNELYKDSQAVEGFLNALAGYEKFTLVIKDECGKKRPPPTPTAFATAFR